MESNNFSNLAVPHDVTLTHNSLYYPPSSLAYANSINALGLASNRNQIEFKGVQRANVSGNYINGEWAANNTTGNAILLLEQGPQSDVLIQSNLITNSGSVMGISGQGNNIGTYNHPFTGNKYFVSNNLAYNLGIPMYGTHPGGVGCQFMAIGTPTQNLIINRNTVGQIFDGGDYDPWVVEYTGGIMDRMQGFSLVIIFFPFGIGGYGATGSGGIYIQPVAWLAGLVVAIPLVRLAGVRVGRIRGTVFNGFE